VKDINNYLAEDFFYICLTSTKTLFLNSYEGNKEIRELPGKGKNKASRNKKILFWLGI